MIAPGLSPAQTFEIPGQQPQAPPSPKKGGRKAAGTAVGWGGNKASSGESSGAIGWGSNIEVSRQARAAEQALKQGNYGTAANFAERAVQAAPSNKALWLQLGYASRLAGRYARSLEAYDHVLASDPSNADAQSGMAQTYIRTGKIDEARQMLNRVIAANPKRVNDILVLGDMEMQKGDPQRAVNVLQRAEQQAPSPHAELLMAV